MGAHRVSHSGGGANLLRGVGSPTLLFAGDARCPRAGHCDVIMLSFRCLVLVVICIVIQSLAIRLSFLGFFGDGFWVLCVAFQCYSSSFYARYGEAVLYDSRSESLTIMDYHRHLVIQDCKVRATPAILK